MWARIDGGAVAELTDADPEGRFHPDLVWAPCEAGVALRWRATQGDGAWHFAAPSAAPAVPQSVSAFQARAAMQAQPSRANPGRTLLDDAAAAVAASPDPLATLAWEYATSFERSSPLLNALAPALGLAAAELDALFVAAAAISA